MGWVTPLGSGVSTVWERLLSGDVAASETISSPLNARTFEAFRVPPEGDGESARAPAAAPLECDLALCRRRGAWRTSGCTSRTRPRGAERTAVIFAVSNGGVIYTKRFYHEVVESGAQAASPLLFPETVFNAPASHLAAILGITGASYTLVGDGAVGLLALKMAEDLLQSDSLDRCLVVAAEEADWLLCDAYRRWHLLRTAPPIEPFRPHPRGMILSEGAGAIVVDRTGPTAIEKIDAGSNFRKQREAAACVDQVFSRLAAGTDDFVVASANGTFIDAAEATAIAQHCPRSTVYTPKVALGEGVGAASLWQVICAAQMLRTGAVPPMSHSPTAGAFELHREPRRGVRTRRAIVSVCGMNQQVAGLSLRVAD
jgi:3-oxoacyl-(acyl-carrier-protein) synthase